MAAPLTRAALQLTSRSSPSYSYGRHSSNPHELRFEGFGKHNGKDVTRCGIARPCHGYVSAKMLQDTKRKPEKSFFDLTPQDVAWQKEKAEKEAAEAAAGGGGDDDRGNE